MGKGRLEAFSDGVLAVIITIMVLELHPPESPDLQALFQRLPAFFGYVLSFVFIGIYWNNHHHLFHAAERVNGPILWANNFLLFWLSLVPFTTGWMDETGFAAVPVALYGAVLFMSGVAFFILAHLLIGLHGPDSALAKAFGRDLKGWISPILCVLGIGSAFVQPWIACCLYVAVAVIWFIPDRRIERTIARE